VARTIKFHMISDSERLYYLIVYQAATHHVLIKTISHWSTVNKMCLILVTAPIKTNVTIITIVLVVL
jgi:hypothetical protein